MAKNTIGQFIAALRKANGMTQQDVADRLNVSNKAVSRWERDECAPDLSVIPALAEMLGVTCDELLRGERVLNTTPQDKKEPRVEKQVKNLVIKTLSGFKTLIWISLTIALVGLVCMFGISYCFYRPVIGFTAMLLFELCALVIAVIAVSRTKDVKTDNELFEMADESLVFRFNNTLGILSFISFFTILAVLLLSLPLVLKTTRLVNGFITLDSYFLFFFGGIMLILEIVWMKCRNVYVSWISSGALPQKTSDPINKTRQKMDLVQGVLIVTAGVLFFIATYYDDYRLNKSTILCYIAGLLGPVCLLAIIISFIVFLVKAGEKRTKLLIHGIRNILFIPSVAMVPKIHDVDWMYIVGSTSRQLHEYWYPEYLGYALAIAAVVLLLFSLLDAIVYNRQKNRWKT